ncbi:ATP-binding protein [Undibacterium sp. TJN25]|uniref:ATP-binding protein n=1 Tax=Undibacterium sp. TJN25 TaxID=3413056 RepID=UPI003BF42331
MRTIRKQLLLTLLAGTFFCTVLAGGALFFKINEEANELFDAQLKQVANSLPIPIGDQRVEIDKDGPEELVVLQAWDESGKAVYISDEKSLLPRYHGEGLKTVAIDAERWRVFVRHKQGLIIQVAQPDYVRQELAAKIALRCLLPFLLMLPILAAIIWVAVGRGLIPLNIFADAVSKRSPSALQPLSTEGLTPEVKPLCDALNDLLRQLDTALTTQRAFIADAAHELRTPLAAFKLQLQLVERATDEAQRTIAMEKLHDRLDRSSHLVQQLLILARHEPGPEPQPFGLVDAQAVARQIVIDYYPLAVNRSIELGLDTAEHFPEVHGNADDLRILLGNLVDNALRYTPAGGNVDISARVVDGHPLISVADNGPGIPVSEHERVFDRFYRGEQTDSWGSGLGLSISKNIADMHGAALKLGATAQGTGLTISLIFPAARASG